MLDWQELSEDARGLLESLPGRQVTLVKLASAPISSSTPWRTESSRSVPEKTLTINAVFVPASGMPSFGRREVQEDIFSRAEQVLLYAPGPNGPEGVHGYNEVVDTDGSRWTITYVDTLSPSTEILLYSIGVKR
jgi:hypothetical protein